MQGKKANTHPRTTFSHGLHYSMVCACISRAIPMVCSISVYDCFESLIISVVDKIVPVPEFKNMAGG